MKENGIQMTKMKMVSNSLSLRPRHIGIDVGDVEALTTAAEDYYGNDYPEDEIDFDDEYDRDAYKYRKYASDDEEYDEESGSRSDGDYGEKLP